MEQQEYTSSKKRQPNWIAYAVFGAILIGLGYWAFAPGSSKTDNTTATTSKEQTTGADGDNASNTASAVPIVYDDEAFNIGACTWPLYVTAVDFNNGLVYNEGSRFLKEFGLKVNINIMDDFLTTRASLASGAIDAVWATVDAFSSEASDLVLEPTEAKIVIATDCSEGADVMIVLSDVKSVSDLKGKTIAYAALTPSHSFLMNTLQTGGLTIDDVNSVQVNSPAEAAAIFKSGKADAVVLWKPEDASCLSEVEGSRVLISTKVASSLIYNVFLVRREYLAKHKDRVVDFFTGWMKANAELKAGGQPARERMAQALVTHMGWTDKETALRDMDNGRFLTIGDNLNLFGMNQSFKGMKANDIYTKFGAMYLESGSINKKPPMWNTVFDRSVIDEVASRLKGAEHKAEGRKEFSPVTASIAEEPALTHLSVTVNFATNSATLDDKAKNIIKRQFGDAVKTNSSARIRVVGNTDNTGNAEANRKLSLRRANAVKNYLVEEYDSDPNRFIVIGNGPKAAIADQVDGDSEEYRRTDFELVEE